MSTRYGDRLYSSYIVLASNPKRSPILSLGRKLISVSCMENSKIDASVGNFGFIVNG